MRFLHPERDELMELSLDDVFILPGFYEGSSRTEVELSPVDFRGGSHPVVSANMNAVTGKRMAETVARYGGLGVLPQDMDAATVARIVAHIKAADPRLDTPLTVSPDATLRDVAGLIRKRAHDMVLVVDPQRVLLGVVTAADLRRRDQYTRVSQLMSTAVVTLPPAISDRQAFEIMDSSRVKAAPVIDGRGEVLGILTREGVVRQSLIAPSLDGAGRLLVAAALGIAADAPQRAEAAVAAGADVLVLDTAHGHQRRMLSALRDVRAAVGQQLPLVAGNVCTAEGTRELLAAGADIIKVNVGPGAMCTTRMQTGAGRPTFSAVRACAEAARGVGGHVWADGGVRAPRDVALYMAAGASRVMVGTWLAGTYESPGDLQEDPEGFLYKENYGMASARAVQDRTAELDSFERARKGFFREGISSSRIYLREGQESVGAILVEIITGLQSAFTYAGAQRVEDFQRDVVIGVQTAAGFGEGKPHGRVRR